MSFEVLAPHYRWLEFVLAGNKLQLCRTAFLSQAAEPNQVLILGEGNGRFLLECRKRFTRAQITCVDASAKMLNLARQRLVAESLPMNRVEFFHADALEWTPPRNSFDLLVTNFFLDCFRPEQLERIIAVLAASAKPTATWWLADFQIPAEGFPRLRALLIHRLMYAFFRVVTRLPACKLTPPDPFLRAHGFVLQRRLVREWGLLHADEWKR
jgi:ubiquinone/menaquinone biosynthesis C-methylase UbiE